ncbi:MAG TPA: DUF397 domain-containing protein [Streptomyces sp.]|nr:DUF397 domain-containing protein [Streptomyces sp.]
MPIGEWQRSSFCGGGGNNCVEVSKTTPTVDLRESEDPSSVITTTPARLAALIGEIKDGRFDDMPR